MRHEARARPADAAPCLIRLRDRELARRLGENGRKRMLAGFTLAHTVAGIEALLAATSARAPEDYRVTTTLARMIVAPFRLLPVFVRASVPRKPDRGRGRLRV